MKKIALVLGLLVLPVLAYAGNTQVYPCFSTTANLLSCLISNYSIVWPAHQGTGSTALINDGSGNLSWQTVVTGGNEVVSVSGSGVITVNPTTGAAVVSLTGIVPTANGGTGVASSAVFPTSGNVATYPVPTASLSGVISVPNGGTGQMSFTAGGVPYGNGSSPLLVTASPAQYQVLVGDSSSVPTFGQVNLATSAAVAGTLSVTNGGTGISATPTDGQLLIGNTSTSGYTKSTITGSANSITVTNTSGGITLSTPQQIAPGSSPTFSTLTLSTSEVFDGASSGATTVLASSTASGVLTLPAATDVLVARSTTDTLTNKTLSGDAASNLVNGSGIFEFNSSGTLVAPNASGTLVTQSTTDTLTNKTIDGASNTLTVLASSQLSGQAPVANGGTGDASFTLNSLVVGNGTSPLLVVTNNGSATNEFLTQTSSGAPVWATIQASDVPLISLTTGVSGILPAANGGTGVSSSAVFPTSGNIATYPLPTASISGVYVASISGVAPIVVTGTSEPAVSITQSTTSTNGYLSSTDWNTFNNKVSATYPVPTASLSGVIATASLSGVVATANGGTGVSGSAVFPTSGNVATYPVPTASLSGVLTVPNGGTGDNSVTLNSVVVGNGTSPLLIVTNNGTVTNEFLAQSSSGAPVWAALVASDVPNISASKITSGILGATLGGTGVSSSAVFPTSGALVTETGTETLTNKALTQPIIATVSNAGVLTLPATTDTLVARATTDTLTNKSLSGSSNTFTSIPLGTAVTGILGTTLGGTGVSGSALFPSSGTVVTESGSETLTNKVLTTPVINSGAVFNGATAGATTVIATASGPSYIFALPSGTGNSGQILSTDGTGKTSWVAAGGTGSVTSVSLADSGGIFSNTGSPVTTSGTLTENVTGTSGGIPYFSSSSQLQSSGILTSHGVIYGGGAASSPVVTAAGTNNQVLVANSSGVPTFGSVQLASSAAVTGVLTVPNGGTGGASFTTNSVIVGASAGALAIVTNNSSATNKFLTQSSSGAPVWATIVTGDIPNTITAATTFTNGINVPTSSGAGVNVYSTTFTPTINSGSGGITGDSPGTMYVSRVGNNVTCSGTIGITSNSAAEQSFNLTLPITTTSSFANGSFIAINSTSFSGIVGNASNTQAFVDFIPMIGTVTYHYIFQYQIN